MRYFGGKFRVAKKISEYINSLNSQVYLEPFCGSCWVGELVQAPVRIFSDLNSDLIAMWTAVQQGWVPPDSVSEEEYKRVKTLPGPDPLRGFVGFGCSFAGKFWGGYARGKYDYAATAKRQVLRRIFNMKNVEFICANYAEALTTSISTDIIYCDPPYKGTTKYYGLKEMDYETFYDTVRSCPAICLVSEYNAPEDFAPVLSIETRLEIRNKDNIRLPRVEKLFAHRDTIDKYNLQGYKIAACL